LGIGPTGNGMGLSASLLRCDRPVLRSLVEIYATAFACIDRRNARFASLQVALAHFGRSTKRWVATTTGGGDSLVIALAEGEARVRVPAIARIAAATHSTVRANSTHHASSAALRRVSRTARRRHARTARTPWRRPLGCAPDRPRAPLPTGGGLEFCEYADDASSPGDQIAGGATHSGAQDQHGAYNIQQAQPQSRPGRGG
jgi:hypothetical protein